MATSPNPTLICWICGKAVDLETCKTDDHGSAVHGLCYLAKVSLAERTQMREKPNGDGSTPELPYPHWQKPLHAALVETDHSRLRQKILDAEAAMFKRKKEIATASSDGNGSHLSHAASSAELMAISDALSSLEILRRELSKKSRQ